MEAVVCDRCGKLVPRQRKERRSYFTPDLKLIDGIIDEDSDSVQRVLCLDCFNGVVAEIDAHTKCYRT